MVLGVFAGALGAIVGIGGGIVIVPVLVLGFGIDIRVAIATSLVAVVATSTAAGSAYVGRGLSNMRLGMTLEITTTLGGITGGVIAILIAPSALAGLFVAMMIVTAVLMARRRKTFGWKRQNRSPRTRSGGRSRARSPERCCRDHRPRLNAFLPRAAPNC